MYFQQFGRKRRKNKYRAVFACAVTMAAIFTFLSQKKNLSEVWKREMVKAGCKEVVEVLTPGLLYEEESRNHSFLARVEKIIFPIAEYAGEMQSYETEVESKLSYDMILAMEALDENYVDESGQVVLNTMPAEQEAQDSMQSETVPTDSGSDNSGEINEIVQSDTFPVIATQKAVEYSMDKLGDFDYLVQTFYQVDSTTTVKSDQLNVEALTSKSMKIAHDAGTPQILIYHTHSLEGYADSVPGDPSTTVVGVGDYLTEILTEQYGYNVIHDTGEYDTVRNKAYSKAAPALEKILADNPSIDVVIDLHRDGVREDTRFVTNINGTDMAKVMFFNGLSRTTTLGDISYLHNPYIADNLAFSFQMQLTAAEYYPDFTRKIYLKGYRFNMHYCPKTLLVEVGAQTNTLQEAKNAMVPLADVLNKVLSE